MLPSVFRQRSIAALVVGLLLATPAAAAPAQGPRPRVITVVEAQSGKPLAGAAIGVCDPDGIEAIATSDAKGTVKLPVFSKKWEFLSVAYPGYGTQLVGLGSIEEWFSGRFYTYQSYYEGFEGVVRLEPTPDR